MSLGGFRLILASLITAALSQHSFADDLLIAQKRPQPDVWGRVFDLIITAKSDLTIERIIVNDGACKTPGFILLPHHASFGDRFIEYNLNCDPINVKFVTDLGDFDVSWDKDSVLSASPMQVGDTMYFNVTSHYDHLVITDVVANRGHCHLLYLDEQPFPITINYGRMASFVIPCDPIEIQVLTDRGKITFSQHH